MDYQEPAVIEEMLTKTKTIAVIGLSDNPERSSYGVAEAMMPHYNIVPVNPKLESWKGIPCYPSLMAIPEETTVDLVNVFRRSEFLPQIVEECVLRKVKYLWTQLEVIDEAAARKAQNAGIKVVMDACIKVAHSLR